jgi:hypothetical protein
MIYYFAREKTHEVIVCVQRGLEFWRKRPLFFYFISKINKLNYSCLFFQIIFPSEMFVESSRIPRDFETVS